MKIGDAVFVEWEDSYGCSPRWEDLPDGNRPEVMICRSVGWVTRKNNRCIVIVPHIASNERLQANQGCGDMTIPMAAIVRVVKLGVIKKLSAFCGDGPAEDPKRQRS